MLKLLYYPEDMKKSGISKVGGLYLLQQLIKDGDLRFSELSKGYVFMSIPTLAKRLREFQKYGLVERKVKNIPGERLEIHYSITEYGKQVVQQIEEFLKTIKEAASKFRE